MKMHGKKKKKKKMHGQYFIDYYAKTGHIF